MYSSHKYNVHLGVMGGKVGGQKNLEMCICPGQRDISSFYWMAVWYPYQSIDLEPCDLSWPGSKLLLSFRFLSFETWESMPVWLPTCSAHLLHGIVREGRWHVNRCRALPHTLTRLCPLSPTQTPLPSSCYAHVYLRNCGVLCFCWGSHTYSAFECYLSTVLSFKMHQGTWCSATNLLCLN